MPASLATLLRRLHRFASPADVPESDALLLDRFIRGRDEGAFAALVRRHGPLVLRVCRRVLADAEAAADACQAVFCVLARRARDVRPPEALAAWLHGVARRLARKARSAEARRLARQAPSPNLYPSDPRPDPLAELSARELLDVVDEEVSRLPEAYRLPVILCCLEGRTREEAARLLGWPAGSVKGRLERGRARLHTRLLRRGLTLPAALAAVEVTRGAASLPPSLETAALRTGLAFAARDPGVCGRLTALVEGGLSPSGTGGLKWALVLFLAVGLVAGSAALLTPRNPDDPPRPAAAPVHAPQPATPAAVAPTDRYGDPLPPGAVARLGTVRFRHPGQIMGFALSPDGKTLATGGYPGRIRLWEASTGRPAGNLRGPAGHILSLRFTPDGTALAAAGSVGAGHQELGQTLLLDLRSGKARLSLRHPRWARCLAFSPDGSTLAVGCDGGGLRTWDVASGKERPALASNSDAGFASVAFSPDGRLLAAGGYDRVIRLWDWRSGRAAGRLEAGGAVRSLVFTADSKNLLSGGDGPHFVRLWDVAGRKVVREFLGHKGHPGTPFPGAAYAVALSPDGRTVASGGDDATVFLCDAITGARRGGHRSPAGSVHGVAFTPDGKTLATGGTAGRVRLFDAADGKERPLFDEHTGGLADLDASPDGKLLATASADGTIRLWDLAARRTVRVLRGHAQGVYSARFSPNGRSLVSAGATGSVRVWDVATGAARRRIDGHGWGSRAVFTPDGKLIASAGGDGKVRLWDPASGREVGKLEGHAGHIVSLDVSADGKWLATTGETNTASGEDRTVRVWALAKRAESRRFTRGDFYSGPQRFTPDARQFVFADGGRLRFVDLATGRELRESPCTGVANFSFAAGGRWLVTVGRDGAVRLVETASGLELWRLAPQDAAVRKAVVAPGGRTLLTVNEDATVLIWDLAPGGGAADQADGDRLWASLDGAEGPAAYRAMWALTSDPRRAVAELRRRLPRSLAEASARDRRIRDLAARLDGKSFKDREAAAHELADLGAEAEPALRQALAASPSEEARRRLEGLLAKAGPLRAGEALRCLRALTVLEHTGTPEARQVLQTAAEGPGDFWLVREARGSLRRLGPGRGS